MKKLIAKIALSFAVIGMLVTANPAHATSTVKAYVNGMYSGSSVMAIIVYYINTSTNTLVDSNNVFLYYGTDITQFTTTELVSQITTGILAESVAQGFGMSASDIIWISPSLSSARAFSTPTFSSATTATQLSTTRDAQVQYAADATVSISLLAGQSVTETLQYADNSGMSTNVVTVDSAVTSNSGVLGLTQVNTLKVSGEIPAGKYRKVTFTTTGSGTTAPSILKSGQEVLE